MTLPLILPAIAAAWMLAFALSLDDLVMPLFIAPEARQHDRLCELNVIEQVGNVCHTTIVRDAWQRGQPLAVHSWIYGLKDGIIRNLGMSISSIEELAPQYHAAQAALVSFAAPKSMLAVKSTPSLLLSRPGLESAGMPMSLAKAGLSAQPVTYREVSAGMAGAPLAGVKGWSK